MTQPFETRLENLLAAVTDAILTDEPQLGDVFERYAVPRAEVEDLIQLIQRLKGLLPGVRPSRRYVARLRQDLMGETEARNVVDRWRYLPPRVQIAALLALMAGVALLSRRRLVARLEGDTQAIGQKA